MAPALRPATPVFVLATVRFPATMRGHRVGNAVAETGSSSGAELALATEAVFGGASARRAVL